MPKTGLSPESEQTVGLPPDTVVEVNPETGDRTLRITRRDSITGKPNRVVEIERDETTNRVQFYGIKTFNAKGEILSKIDRIYYRNGMLMSIFEETPFFVSVQEFHYKTGIRVSLKELTTDDEIGDLLVEKKFDYETGKLIDFWGSRYNHETGDPISSLHETFDRETNDLTLRQEYVYDLATKGWELVAEVIPSQSSQEQP
jgi:hypothetical protein